VSHGIKIASIYCTYKYINILALEMPSPEKQRCASCIIGWWVMVVFMIRYELLDYVSWWLY